MTFKDIAQSMFDKVWERAKTPKPACRERGMVGCFYRVSPTEGTKGANACFIGVCIPDEEYKPQFEGKRARCLIVDGFWQPKGADQLPPDDRRTLICLCSALQAIHDSYDPEDWPKHLRDTAQGYQLTIPTDKGTNNDTIRTD